MIAELFGTPEAYRADLISAEQIEQHLVELDHAWFSEDVAVFGMARELAQRHPAAARREWWLARICQRAIDLQAEQQRRIAASVQWEAEYNARQKAERRTQRKAERQASKQAPLVEQPAAPAAAPVSVERGLVERKARAFLRYLHDDQAGYIEIVAGETDPHDPRKIKMLMHTRRWCYFDPERPDLLDQHAAYAGQLAAEYGNVYTSIRTYRTKERAEKHANAGRVIFVDDAPAAPSLPYSASIRTSSASRHAYYKCNAPVTKDDARRAAAALGGDPSGVDLTQLVRFPGTLNTKNGQNWQIQTETASGPIYSLDQVRAAFPAVAGSSSKISGTSWGDAYHAENWQNLPDGALLWRSAYIAAAAKRRPDLAKLLRGERVTLIKKDGTRDDSDSAQVAALAYNLLSADVCKLQARAIADYLYPQIRPSKSREHYRAHFDAELERYTPKHYRSQTIRAAAPAGQQQQAGPQPLPPAEYRPEPKSRARKDRPQRVSGPAGYLTWLRSQVDPQSGSVMLSQSQCAERIGCNIRTIKRYEKALGGQIERRIFAQRQAGCLFILASDVVTTSPDDVVIAATEAAQQNAENAESATVQEEHTAPPVTAAPEPPPARPRLPDLVRAAFDAVRVDHETGEKKKSTRRRLMIALGPLTYSDRLIDQVITDERQRRRIAAIVADIGSMSASTLRAQLRLLERLSDKSREQGSQTYRYTDWAAGEMRAELGRRPAESRRQPRKNCEALPDPRAVGAAYQESLLQLVDQARATTPRPAPIAVAEQGSRGAGVSLQIPPAAAGPAVADYAALARTMADRFRARQAAPAGGAD